MDTRQTQRKRKRAKATDEEPIENHAEGPEPQQEVPDTFSTPAASKGTPLLPTPTRATRIEEKMELQDLNKRLEFYIIKQRERDAAQHGVARDFEDIKLLAEKEKEDLRVLYENQLKELRASREQQANDILVLKENHREQAGAMKQLLDDIAALKKKANLAETRADSLSKDLSNTKSKLVSAEDDIKKLAIELDAERIASDSLKELLQKERQKAEAATADLNKLESKKNSLEEDLSLLKNRSEQEIKLLSSQIAELSQGRAGMEEELRQEFGKQLKDIISDMQNKYDEERDEGFQELKNAYDSKIAAHRDAIEKAVEEADNLRRQLADEQEKNAGTRGRSQELEKKVIELEETVRTLRVTHERDSTDKKDTIKRITSAFKRKDEEFDQLMDIKIALAQEIKAYRLLLENEEERLGYTSPSRTKRKKADSGTVYIASIDLNHGRLIIRNGSDAPVSMDGYTLKSASADSEFKFPDVTLPAGGNARVWLGEDSEERPSGDLFWGVNVDRRGDSFFLMDGSGKKVSVQDAMPLSTP